MIEQATGRFCCSGVSFHGTLEELWRLHTLNFAVFQTVTRKEIQYMNRM